MNDWEYCVEPGKMCGEAVGWIISENLVGGRFDVAGRAGSEIKMNDRVWRDGSGVKASWHIHEDLNLNLRYSH